MKKFEFEAINSGDGEAFCWIVDKDTFARVTGNEPEEHDGLLEYTDDGLDYTPSKEKFLLYPEYLSGEQGVKVKISIMVENLEVNTENEN